MRTPWKTIKTRFNFYNLSAIFMNNMNNIKLPISNKQIGSLTGDGLKE